MNILIIEDDVSLSKNIHDAFVSYNFCNRIKQLFSFSDFLIEYARISSYDIVLLDINLGPSENKTGFDILEYIRKIDIYIPVIIISSNSAYSYIEKSFLFGAHDYILKPFRNRELKIRIERWYRNYVLAEYFSLENELVYADICYSFKKHEFFISEKQIKLSKGAKYIFLILFIYKEQLVKRDFLVDKIWGLGEFDQNSALRIGVMRLKKQLSAYGLENCVSTVRGEGYMLTR
ncbi:response regulator transcription factor [Candidatus Gracilibacteria bacterium]|nr:response regulator transcription factor [Candidatus Gracilibacteria bacterium]